MSDRLPLATILPSNAMPLQRALDLASGARLDEMPVDIRDLWSAERCPAPLLGWLAWALSVDHWDDSWTEAQKRKVIGASYDIHRVKGTIGAVRRALDALGIHVEVREWFQTGDAPGTFRIDAFADYIFAAGFGVNAALISMISRQIDTVKRASQHYTLRIGERFATKQPLRVAVRDKQRDSITHDPMPRTYADTAYCQLRSAFRDRQFDRQTLNIVSPA